MSGIGSFWVRFGKKEARVWSTYFTAPRSFRSDDAVDDDVNDAMCGFSSDTSSSALLSFHSPHRAPDFSSSSSRFISTHTRARATEENVYQLSSLSPHTYRVETTEAFQFFFPPESGTSSAPAVRESLALGTIWNTLTKKNTTSSVWKHRMPSRRFMFFALTLALSLTWIGIKNEGMMKTQQQHCHKMRKSFN